MKSYSISSDSSSDDEALIVFSKKNQNAVDPDCNSYSSLREQDWQQCEFCDEVFANRYSLIRHNISHIIIPLIKQTSHQCKQCLHHFVSIEDLNTHTSIHHPIDNKETILQSIITNQVVIQCQDNLKEVINKHNKYKKEINLSNEDIHNNTNTNQTETVNSDIYNQNESYCYIRNVESLAEESRGNLKTKTSIVGTIDDDIYIKKEVKEEPMSPVKFERSSSPTDEEKESIKHRLLFEEDVEDTLFKDLSAECQVNIETLCKEVTLDFDDALFEDDETLTLDSNDATDKFENRINNLENGKLGTATNSNCIRNVTNEHRMKSLENFSANNKLETANNYQNRNNFIKTKECESNVNNLNNETNIITNGCNNINNIGMENFNERLENVNILNACTIQTVDLDYYGRAIHYDTLVVPDINRCKYCQKEFPNRLELVMHETKHMRVRKPHMRSPLCCYCDKYIAGNYRILWNHKRKVHPEKAESDVQFKKNNCPKCKLQYYNFMKHLKNYHEPYLCNICEKGFETEQARTEHECGKPKVNLNFAFGRVENEETKTSVMQLCDLCFSFMKIYIQNRHNYEEVGFKNQFGVRQTCDKCNNLFFTVKLVRRRALARLPEENKKVLDAKSKVKPMSNKERLLKIQNRLKMMKKINKC